MRDVAPVGARGRPGKGIFLGLRPVEEGGGVGEDGGQEGRGDGEGGEVEEAGGGEGGEDGATGVGAVHGGGSGGGEGREVDELSGVSKVSDLIREGSVYTMWSEQFIWPLAWVILYLQRFVVENIFKSAERALSDKVHSKKWRIDAYRDGQLGAGVLGSLQKRG